MHCYTAVLIHSELLFFNNWALPPLAHKKLIMEGSLQSFVSCGWNSFSSCPPYQVYFTRHFIPGYFLFPIALSSQNQERKKKKGPAKKATAMPLGTYTRGSCFSDLFGSVLTRDFVSAAMAQWWWWCTISPCMAEPCYIHTVFRNFKFQEFLLSMCKLHFLKAYNLARFEQISSSQKQQKAHPPTKAILSNLNSLSQLGGGRKGGGCYHFSK